jgi:hypothetical protein
VTFRVLCAECDVAMNELAMLFVFGDSPEVRDLLEVYRNKVLGPSTNQNPAETSQRTA